MPYLIMIAKQTLLGGFLLTLITLALAPLSAQEKEEGEKKKPDPGEKKVTIALGENGKPSVYIRKKHISKLKLKEVVEVAEDLKITHAGTCMFIQKKDGTMEVVPAKEIPMEPKKRFGWVFRANTTRDTLAFYELFTVPKDPNWNKNVSVSGDPKTAKTDLEEPVWDWVWRNWYFEDGDPLGKHMFTLKIEEKAIGLEFEVVEKKASK